MNLKNEDFNQKEKPHFIKTKNNKMKENKKNSIKCLKRESSGLIDMIE